MNISLRKLVTPLATAFVLSILISINTTAPAIHAQIPLLPSKVTPAPTNPTVSSNMTTPANMTSMPTNSTLVSLNFTNATGTIADFQNNHLGKLHGGWSEQIARNGIWILSGKWSLGLPSGSRSGGNVIAPVFDSSFSMVLLNGTGMHKHKISNFTMIGMPITNNTENSTTFKGKATVTMKDGPHTNVPISITIIDKSVIRIGIDRIKTANHFGPMPIFGTVDNLG